MAPTWLDELTFPADGPPWLSMGLGRCPEADWLVPDGDRATELALRRRLLTERTDEVFAALAGTEAAGAECLALVDRWLAEHRPDLVVDPDPDGPPVEHPLVMAGRRVQEDLVLMVPRGGGYHLDAACLCFPSHWRLADKLGGSAAAIHGPVPGYAEELAERVDRFLDRVRPGVISKRRNWSVHDSPELFAPVPPRSPRPATVAEVPERLWLRSERQTLRRLPGSGAVLFTIRVQQARFAALVDRPSTAAALADRLRAQPEALTEMNGLTPHLAAVLTWLDRVVAERH